MVKATIRPSRSTPSAMSRPGTKRLVMEALVSSCEHSLDLRLARRDMIEARVEIAGEGPQVLGELFRIENLRQPPQAYQSVHARRKVDPAERQLGRQVHAAVAHRLDRRPGRVGAHAGGKILVDGYDGFGVPQQDLFYRHGGEAAAGFAGDIGRQHFDGLDVDRSTEPGLEPARAACI